MADRELSIVNKIINARKQERVQQLHQQQLKQSKPIVVNYNNNANLHLKCYSSIKQGCNYDLHDGIVANNQMLICCKTIFVGHAREHSF